MIQIVLYFTQEPEEKCKFRPSFSDNENGDDLLGDDPVEKETENRPLSPRRDDIITTKGTEEDQ